MINNKFSDGNGNGNCTRNDALTVVIALFSKKSQAKKGMQEKESITGSRSQWEFPALRTVIAVESR